MTSALTIYAITPAETIPLRLNVLRPGRPLAQAIFAEDDEPGALHLGAFTEERLVGIASFYPRPFPPEDEAEEARGDWQLRGMAVAPEQQGQGCGRALLEHAAAILAHRGARRLWCNARLGALGFYRAQGFEVVGEEFDIPDVGPHFLMRRRIAPQEKAEAASST